MGQDLRPLYSAVESLSLFAIATQCALAWVFSLLFVAFSRNSSRPPHLSSWTLSFLARAIALSAILLRFAAPILSPDSSHFAEGSLYASVFYGIYQSAKFLAFWFLLEGVLRFTGSPAKSRATSWIPVALVAAALGTLIGARNVLDLLRFQCILAIASGLYGAYRLTRIRSKKKSLGTRTTTAALLCQALLWSLYLVPFTRAAGGQWPKVQSFWTFIAAQNSYLDLGSDVLLASGLVVLLLQDLNRRRLEVEAEQNRMRKELDLSEKLRSLGTLVSGVAHELNNPLSSILGFAESLASPDGDEDRVRQAEIIREQTLRCRRIVRGLSTFSGKGSEVMESVETRILFERVVNGLELELARRQVRAVIDVPDPAPTLIGDRFALEQLLTNLLYNAMQVSPPRGSVTLMARVRQNELELSVEDDGPGIASELLPHIFDPFFTTRITGEGMGLGLAVCHGIARSHGGTIRAYNRQPHGTRMVVTLPWREQASTGKRAPLQTKDIPRPDHSSARPLDLLVIEDEESLCEAVDVLGRGRGWRVTIATSGKAGLELLRGGGKRFDVVLCDLRMGPPSGMDIHDSMVSESPELLERFLFLTGDLASREAHDFASRCSRPILSKPLGRDELTRSIEGLAAERSAC
jgi:signal transduction histidine kinase/CheY-like chemotaxis protein